MTTVQVLTLLANVMQARIKNLRSWCAKDSVMGSEPNESECEITVAGQTYIVRVAKK